MGSCIEGLQNVMQQVCQELERDDIVCVLMCGGKEINKYKEDYIEGEFHNPNITTLNITFLTDEFTMSIEYDSSIMEGFSDKDIVDDIVMQYNYKDCGQASVMLH